MEGRVWRWDGRVERVGCRGEGMGVGRWKA